MNRTVTQKTRSPRADGHFMGQRIAERFLTLFIIAIFCLSAAQVAILAQGDIRRIGNDIAHAEFQRNSRLLLQRGAHDLETTILGYYLGSENTPAQELERQQAYLIQILGKFMADHATAPDLQEIKESLLLSLDRLNRYADLRRPLTRAQGAALVSDLNDYRITMRKMLDYSLNMRPVMMIPELNRQHEFLMASIVSMAFSGLGLIVLLLMKLRASEKLLQERRNLHGLLEPRIAAIETAMDGVAITDGQGALRYVNGALTSYHGYDDDDLLLQKHWSVLYDTAQKEWFESEIMPVLQREGRWRGHCKGLRRDGSYYHQDTAIAALDDGGYVFVVRDYTELRESMMLADRRLAAIEAARDGIGIVDRDGRLSYINGAMRELHGLTPAQADRYIGRPWVEAYSLKGQNDIAANVMPAMAEKGYWQGEAPILRADGTIIDAELSLTQLPDGGFIGTTRDITARKKVEREKEELQRQFYQAQKMEAIGRMAGGIAHDFNNILSSILGYAEFLLEDIDRNTAQYGFARQIYSGGTQARHLVDQILAFSRRREGQIEPVSLSDSIQNTVDMLRPVMPPAMRMDVTGQDKDHIVRANATQVSQALMNLCVNAIDALEEREDPAITIKAADMVADDVEIPAIMLADELPAPDKEPLITMLSHKDGSATLLCGTLKRGGRYVCVSVGDNGAGMGRDVMQHLFEPFFTTKAQDKGTGLGLSAVHGIITGHRGAMTVRSTEGKGTVFTLYFPQDEKDTASLSVPPLPLAGGSGRILVVDDQADVAVIVMEMLVRLGYDADVTGGGDMAIDLLREKPDYYDLVLTDYAMPEMSGVELAAQIYEDFPTMPVVIMTGYGRKALDRDMRQDHPAIVGVLRKPIDRIVLAQVIGDALRSVEKAA